MDTEVLAHLHSFLLRFHADRAAGIVRTRDSYQELYPRFRDEIARQFDALAGERPGQSERGELGLVEPRAIGPYELLREISRGGQGVVYLARDTRLSRKVALKVLPPSLTADAGRFARFQREAATASRIDHPGICTIYETGIAGGVPFIAMRHVEGETLAQQIAARRATLQGAVGEQLPPPRTRRGSHGSSSSADSVRAAIHLIERAARALHVAHEAGVVHRDIKPGNLMVTPEGDPVLLDFGLARDSDSDERALTLTGDHVGTPAYMSPEQIQTGVLPIDRRTDVYSLGVMLFEAVTLERPFDAPTREALYRAICSSSPPDVLRITPAAPRDLRTVLATALEKDRDRRYQTALDLAADLRAVLDSRPIRARPVSIPGRIARWARREPTRAALAAALAVCVPALAGAGGYLLARRPEIEAARSAAARVAIERDIEQSYMFALLERESDARSILERVIVADPGNVDAIVGLSILEGRTAEGRLAVLDRLSRNCSAPGDLAMIRAQWLRDAGRVAEAEALERTAPASETGLSHFVRGASLRGALRDSNLDAARRALSHLTRAVFISPRKLLFFHAFRALAAGSAGDAAALADSESVIRELWPDSAAGAFAIAMGYTNLDPSRASLLLLRALELDPSMGAAWVALGDLERNRRNLPLAELYHRRAIAVDPSSSWSHYRLAWTLKDSSDPCDWEEAERAALRAIELDPSKCSYRLVLCEVHLKRGELDAACDALLDGLRVEPNEGLLHTWMGRVRLAQGEPQAAREAAEVGVSLAPEIPGAWSLLGAACEQCGSWTEAVQAYRRWLKLDESNATVRERLAKALVHCGELGEARSVVERAVELRPADPEAWNLLAWFLVDPAAEAAQRDAPAGLAAAERARALSDRQDPYILDTWAEALFLNGRSAEAAAAEEQAIELMSGRDLLGFTLAQARASLERYRQDPAAR